MALFWSNPMSKLVIDDTLTANLLQANGGIELVAKDGRALGYFLPTNMYLQLMYAWAREEFNNDPELQHGREKLRKEGGVTTAELLAHLQNLEHNGTQPS
jgi:hypothetical protein